VLLPGPRATQEHKAPLDRKVYRENKALKAFKAFKDRKEWVLASRQ
jgi:hypothetical protein